MRKADENMDQSDEVESSNIEEESTRIKKQRMKEKILEKVSADRLRVAENNYVNAFFTKQSLHYKLNYILVRFAPQCIYQCV